MLQSHSQISIIFSEPFWVALFERFDDSCYSVAREVIGTSEPTGAELKLFFERIDFRELQYTSPRQEAYRPRPSGNYKHQQHKLHNHSETSSAKHTFTKAQRLLKQQRQESNAALKKEQRINTELENKAKFILKQQKKKEKLRGH